MSKPHIGFLTYDWAWGTNPLQPNGCAWYRCLLPSRELKKLGWGIGVGVPGFDEKDGFGLMIENNKSIHGWSIIVLKLLMHKKVLEVMDIAKAIGQTIVVDIDDWHDGLEKTNRAYAATDPANNPENNRDIYNAIMDKADALVTSTPFLAQYHALRHPNVYLVRNGIDIERWKPRPDSYTDKPVVGWVGATPWRSMDLESVAEPVSDFIMKNDLKFHHSGHTQATDAPYAADQLGIPRERTSTLPLRAILDYPTLFQPIDIGLVPLNNVQFNHAKSYIKGLEYAAAGVPFIASWSPEYQLLADAGVGRIANTPEEWEYHLNELLDPEMRNAEAEVNRENVKKLFTMSKRATDWNTTYMQIFNAS